MDTKNLARIDLSGVDSEQVLKRLIAKGMISVEIVNSEIDEIRSEASVQAGVALGRPEKKSVSGTTSKKDLSPEELDGYLGVIKKRFDSNPQYHEGIEWAEVEKALRADTESMAKLCALDGQGHNMNVLGEDNDAFVFGSAFKEDDLARPFFRDVQRIKKT